jgi:hypothetical protein
MKQAKPVVPRAEAALKRHFRTQRTHELVTANRTFPITARVDVQLALERLFVDYVVEMIVRKTDKASAAIIKELMRRSAQFYIQNGSNGQLRPEHLNQALEEMLFSGGFLNAKLLGAEGLSRGTVH